MKNPILFILMILFITTFMTDAAILLNQVKENGGDVLTIGIVKALQALFVIYLLTEVMLQTQGKEPESAVSEKSLLKAEIAHSLSNRVQKHPRDSMAAITILESL